MKKQIREVKNGILQVTTSDERWYTRSVTDPVTLLPKWEYVPSVTWIAGYYPKGVEFYKWLANTGWDESQAIKEAAGDKGSKIHAAITQLIVTGQVKMDDSFTNPSTDKPEPLSLEEYEAVMSFVAWHTATKPRIVAHDFTMWNDVENYAGSGDLAYVLDEEPTVLHLPDVKSSQYIWMSQRLQVSGYKHTPEITALMKQHGCTSVVLEILQVGYRKNKNRYKLTEIEDCFDLFLATKKIWAKETAGEQPLQRDYPVVLMISQPPTATDRARALVAAPATNGGSDNGGVGKLGQEKQQDAHHRGRGNGGSRVSGVQDRAKSV